MIAMSNPNDDFDTLSAEEYYREAGFGDRDLVDDAFEEAQDILYGGQGVEDNPLFAALFGTQPAGEAQPTVVPPVPTETDILF